MNSPTEDGVAPAKTPFLAQVVLACVTYYVAVIVLLHFLSPHVDPRYQFMSEYAVGRYCSLMTTTFFVLSAASFALGVALFRSRKVIRPSLPGLVLLLIWVLMICIAGIFPTDPDEGPRSAAGLIHGRASMLGFTSVILALLLLSASFRRRDSALRPAFNVSLSLALCVLLTFVGIMAGLPFTGLLQRLLLVLILSWHALIALKLPRAV